MVEQMQTNGKAGMNHHASASLLFGMFSIFFPFFTLIFGFTGILFFWRAKKEIAVSGEAGTRRAYAGLVCSVIGLLMLFSMVSLGGIFRWIGIQLNIFY